MDISLALRGLLLGFAIAAPVGPIGVLCIRRTLVADWRIGLVSGLGAATADASYGAVVAFGLTAISGLLVAGQFWLRLLGGLFLGYLGLRALLAKPIASSVPLGGDGKSAAEAVPATPVAAGIARSDLAAYASTLGLTLTNPATILSFAAIFAGLGVGLGANPTGASGGYLDAAQLVIGVFAGSALWWLILSATVAALRARFRLGVVGWVGRASGAVLLTFGLLALASVIPLVR